KTKFANQSPHSQCGMANCTCCLLIFIRTIWPRTAVGKLRGFPVLSIWLLSCFCCLHLAGSAGPPSSSFLHRKSRTLPFFSCLRTSSSSRRRQKRTSFLIKTAWRNRALLCRVRKLCTSEER